MANNLRYLLEHFCLDGQKIDISSQLDEENANNIEKINTQTIPSINARIDDIKNTDIPIINSRIDSIKNTDIPSINQKINTINNTTIPNVHASVTAVDEKADSINEKVAKNTRDISTLSDNVTMQGNAINIIELGKIPKIERDTDDVKKSMANLRVWTGNEITKVKNQQSDDETKINNNTTNIERLTSSINGLATKVDTNTDSINGLTTKVNTNTDSINTINNTSIPHLQSEIDSLSGGGTGSIGELREKVEKNTADITELNGKVETNTADISSLSGKVDSNTSDISALSGKVDSNTTAISTINDTSIPSLQNEISNITKWEQVLDNYQTAKGIIVNAFVNRQLHLIQLSAKLLTPQSIGEGKFTDTIPNFNTFIPRIPVSSSVFISGYVSASTQGNFIVHHDTEFSISFNLPSYNFPSELYATVLYSYF